VTMIQYACLLAFQILLCIQLQEGKWKWAEVFIPIYVYEVLQILRRAVQSTRSKFIELYDAGMAGALFNLGYLGFLIKKWFITLMRVLFIILVVVRLDSTSWGWGVPAIPIFISIVWKLFVQIADSKANLNATTEAEERAAKKSMFTCVSVLMGLGLSVILTFVILVVVKLDGAAYSLAITFIPVFIVFGLLLCICMCVAPCIICCGRGMEENHMYEEAFNNSNSSGLWEIKRQKYLENKPHSEDIQILQQA